MSLIRGTAYHQRVYGRVRGWLKRLVRRETAIANGLGTGMVRIGYDEAGRSIEHPRLRGAQIQTGDPVYMLNVTGDPDKPGWLVLGTESNGANSLMSDMELVGSARNGLELYAAGTSAYPARHGVQLADGGVTNAKLGDSAVNADKLNYGSATYTVSPGYGGDVWLLGIHPQFGLRRFRIAEQATRESWGDFLVEDSSGTTTTTGFISAPTLFFTLPPGTWTVKVMGTLLGDNLSSNSVHVRVNIGGSVGLPRTYPGGAIRPFAASHTVTGRSGSQNVAMQYGSPSGGTTRRFGWNATIIAERTS